MVVPKLHAWLLVAVAVAVVAGVIAFWAVGGLDDESGRDGITDRPGASDNTSGTSGSAATAVADYTQFAAAIGHREGAAVNPEETADGLRKLAGALGALELGSPDLPVDLRIAAEHLVLNPESPATTQAVRADLVKAAAAIGAERPDRAAALRQSAAALDATDTLARQQDLLRQFFRESADALAQ